MTLSSMCPNACDFEWEGCSVHHVHLAETTTTMERLREADLWQQPADVSLLTTDFQTAGRGQRGTVWEARPGVNLLFGFRFFPQSVAANEQFLLSEALALAVIESLDPHSEGFSVKWPNDIYWHDRKICGMLLEHRLQGPQIASTLTGIGINVNQECFSKALPNPISLLQITGRHTDRATLLHDIMQHFLTIYHHLAMTPEATRHEVGAALHHRYMQRLYRREGFHLFRAATGTFEARIADISPMGALCLEDRDGKRRTFQFKEVSFVP